jgi:uncharacterized HAD superfamily protein
MLWFLRICEKCFCTKSNFNLGEDMKIMLDIDDTSVQFNLSLVRFLNKTLNKKVKFDELINYDLSKVYGVAKPVIDLAVEEFYLSQDHLDINPMPQADFVLYNLSMEKIIDEIILVTSRAERFRQETRKLLKKSFPSGILDETELVMLGHYDSNAESVAKSKCKSEICKDFGIEVAIEDNAYHAEKIASCGLTVFMINHPWNRHFGIEEFNIMSENGGQIVRVSGWLSIKKYLEALVVN